MSKKVAALGAGVALLASSAVMAGGYGYGYGNGAEYYGGGLYIGANLGDVYYKEQGFDTIVPAVAFVNIGEEINPYLAVEARVGGGVAGDNFRFFHVDVPLIYGGYVKGTLPVTPWFAGYAIAGVGGMEVHRNYANFNSNDAGFSYGIGGQFTLYGGARLHAEWARIDTGTNDGFSWSADQLSVGVSWLL